MQNADGPASRTHGSISRKPGGTSRQQSGMRAIPHGERRRPRRHDIGGKSFRRHDFSAYAGRNRWMLATWRRLSIADCTCSISWRRHLSFKERHNMHNLGRTRSAQQPNHLLLTPDTFVRTTLPGMKGCAAIVHAGPILGAGFTQYTAEFEPGGELGGTIAQRFVFVIEGAVKLDVRNQPSELSAHGYAYVPAGLEHRITATQKSRVVVIEKVYESLPTIPPPHLIVSHEDKVASHPLADDPGLQVKCLLPDEMRFDFAVNTMIYQPGV